MDFIQLNRLFEPVCGRNRSQRQPAIKLYDAVPAE